MSLRARIIGVGAGLPKHIVTNDELAKTVDTSDEWIRTRTGIHQRHIAGEGEYTSHLATRAAQDALASAGVKAADIDLIIVATSTPDKTMPSTACLVQAALGNTHAMSFDLNAACSGFVYGLQCVNAMLQSGQIKNALLIGAETMSRIVDWNDRATCVLFGDGAGAVVIEAQESDGGILGCVSYGDGQYHEILGTNGGVGSTQAAGVLSMQGQDVFRHAVDKMASAATHLLAQHSLSFNDVDWVIPHQANARIIQSIAKRLHVPQEKCIMTLDQHANTSAASIPLALSVAQKQNKIKPGNLVVLPALGAGLTWGCCIIRW